MKAKTITALSAMMILALVLPGCRLAREDTGTGEFGDKMVGVFVTTEHLDLFDMEGFLTDNPKVLSGGQTSLSGDDQQYQGRLYATHVKRLYESEETGEKSQFEEYVFEGVDGISFFSYAGFSDSGIYTGTMSDEAISGGHVGIFHGDDENRRTMEGTIYVAPADHIVFYINPVYQSADGSIYVTTGSGISVTGASGEGSAMSQTLEETRTITENGTAKTDSISVAISISVMFAPEKVVVLQMDAGSNVIKRSEFTPGMMPDEFLPESATAYILVETFKRGNEGETSVSREIYDNLSAGFGTFSTRPDGICVNHHTLIMW